MEISRRRFLEFGAKSPLVLISANVKAQSLDGKFYDPPENQTWVDFRSPIYPYTIRYPLSWSVFSAETVLDRLTNPRVVKADIFVGGQVGKKTMKVIVASEALTQEVMFSEILDQIEAEGDKLDKESRVINFGWVPYDEDDDDAMAGYSTKFLDFGIERRIYPMTTSSGGFTRGWRIITELQDHEVEVSDFEMNNINRTISLILRSFR